MSDDSSSSSTWPSLSYWAYLNGAAGEAWRYSKQHEYSDPRGTPGTVWIGSYGDWGVPATS